METTIEVKSLDNGDVQLVVTGRLPQATMSENKKYPWGPWQVTYNSKLVENDAARILQAVANARHVEQMVGARATEREAAKKCLRDLGVKAEPALLNARSGKSATAALIACELLEQHGTAAALEPLKTAAESGASRNLRLEATAAAEAIRKRIGN